MAFEGLSEKITSAFKKLKSRGRLSEADVKSAMREIKLALLEADVNFKVVKDFTKTVTERATGAEILCRLSQTLTDTAHQCKRVVCDKRNFLP